jgi:hypothetical protein
MRSVTPPNWRRLLHVQRNGDIGSPRSPGSTRANRSVSKPGSGPTSGLRPPPVRRTRPGTSAVSPASSFRPARSYWPRYPSPATPRQSRHTRPRWPRWQPVSVVLARYASSGPKHRGVGRCRRSALPARRWTIGCLTSCRAASRPARWADPRLYPGSGPNQIGRLHR